MTETRTALLAELSDELLAAHRSERLLIAVDGVDGAGKTRFADHWAELLRARGVSVVRASIDGFHRPRAERYARGRDSAEGYYRDSFDHEALRERTVVPFRTGASEVVTAVFDYRADAERVQRAIVVPQRAVLLVDGVFLHRPELARLWHRSVWLEVPAEVAAARLLARDGEGSLAPRYSEGQAIYRREAQPHRTATIVIDNADHEHPRRVFADFC
ncbi:MAG: uridine kinase [Microcella sp.]